MHITYIYTIYIRVQDGNTDIDKIIIKPHYPPNLSKKSRDVIFPIDPFNIIGAKKYQIV